MNWLTEWWNIFYFLFFIYYEIGPKGFYKKHEKAKQKQKTKDRYAEWCFCWNYRGYHHKAKQKRALCAQW